MFLEKIAGVKREEIQRRKTPFRQKALEGMIPSLPLPRNVLDSVSQHLSITVVAEIKRASPSLGMIHENVDILQFARAYEEGGASVISILTEPHFFKGDLSYLSLVKKEITLPILQKDFILDPFQIYEGRASGADAILLIAALLDQEQLKDFVALARSLHMVPLVEIHDQGDLQKISALDLRLIGINNRDLKTFEVSLRTTLDLMKEIPSTVKVISESGIKSAQDVRLLKEAGVRGILVGEILMRSPDPASKIRELLKP